MTHRRLALGTFAVLATATLALAVHNSLSEEKDAAPPADAGTNSPAAERTANKPPPAAVVPPKRAAIYKSVLIEDVPHVRQKPDFCGEACAAMYLRKLGRTVDQDYVFDQSGLDAMLGRGCHTKELAAALRNIGFRAGQVWYTIPTAGEARTIEAQWKALHADLAAGVPSIICTHYHDRPGSSEHFRLILGYDAKTDEVVYHEPAEDGGAYRRMKRTQTLKLWPLRYKPAESTLIRLRLEPGVLRSGKPAETFTAADYAQHMMKLNKKIPDNSFTVVIQAPFVVIGDESPAMVKRRAEGTVKWAVDRLKAAYFSKDPKEILDIWLFKDAKSYRKYTKQIFNHQPDTPFGYYSDSQKALVMNIGTGGGTLVHEIVHPFVASNFPQCPSWLNEGLGSLYEQSASRDGRIVGLTNWRLNNRQPNGEGGLQLAIRQRRVPSFETLCSATSHQFYREDRGTNYAQARYLCYWLQEHGLLKKYYHQFHANCRQDPTGYNTLKAVLGRDDVDKFEQEWEAWVLKLRFP